MQTLLLTQQKTPKKYKAAGMVIAKQKQPPLRVNLNGLKMQAIAHLTQRLQGAVIKAKPAKTVLLDGTTKTGQTVQNGKKHPKPDTNCGIVWAMCDKLYTQLGYVPTNKQVVAACDPLGINKNTSGSEVSQWRIFNGL